jgi:hypothetical protein
MSKPDIKNLPALILDRLMNQLQITNGNYNPVLQYLNHRTTTLPFGPITLSGSIHA